MATQMRIGTTRPGGRLHLAVLTPRGGFSKCGRKLDGEVWQVGQRPVSVDGPWCGSCLNREVGSGLRDAALDFQRAQNGQGLFRLRRDERPPVGRDGETGAAWDASACRDIGTLILDYLEGNPPPPGSRFADNLRQSGELLIREGGEGAE